MLFGRSLVRFQRTAFQGVRFNSTSKVQSTASGLSSKVSFLINQTVFWGKVVAELGKQVYVKEGLAPPKVKDFETVYKSLYAQALQYVKNPQKVLDLSKSFKITKECVVKYGAIGVQLFGLFSLGEIIGRRKVFGYPVFGHEEHSH